MSTTLDSTPELKYRLDELTNRLGITRVGAMRLRKQIQRETGKARETVARWYSYPISGPNCISLEDGIIISKILKCRPEELLTPVTIELFKLPKTRVA